MSLHRRQIHTAVILCLLAGSACSSPARTAAEKDAGPSGPAPAATVQEGAPAGEPAPEVIGEVNGRPLYKPFYAQNLEYIENRLSKGEKSADVERYLNARFEAFDMLVQDELLAEEARRRGIDVPEDDVRAELARQARVSGGEAALLAVMRSRGIGRAQLLEGIRRKLTVDRFMKDVIAPGLTVTEDEAVAFYNQHLERFTPEAWVKASHIFVSCPRDADAQRVRRARDHAQQILDALRAGASFEELAREHSEDGTASDGGNLGRMKKGHAPPEVDAVAFSIPLGQISDLVRTDKGFHIIKVADRIGGSPRPYREVAEACRKSVLSRKQAAAIADLTERLRSNATIVSHLP